MSKLPDATDRSMLPKGWQWANWEQSLESDATWKSFEEITRQKFRHCFMAVTTGIATGRMPPHEIFFYCKDSGGIGKAKAKKPRPGWRGWCFRDGSDHYITHFSPKLKKGDDHDTQVEIALAAKAEHMARKKKQQQGKR